MADELFNEQSTVDDSTVDYISAINELKQNTVDRSKYEQLRAENKRLINSIVNGQPVDVEAPKRRSIDEIRKDWLNEDNSNLAYIKNTLELREALIAEGKPDPFLPVGNQIAPTDEDIATADRVAKVLQECVDFAEGDSEVFTNELQRRTIDIKFKS